MARLAARPPDGQAVQQLEGLIRTAIFKPATGMVGWLLQQAADRVDREYQPRPGEHRKARVGLEFQCLFGRSRLERNYYYHAGRARGALPGRRCPGVGRQLHPRLGSSDLPGRGG